MFQKFSDYIQSKNIAHDRFLIIMTLLMIFGVLLEIFMLFLWYMNGIISQVYFQSILLDSTRGMALGILAGLVASGIILLFYYRKEEWDLHIVIPNYLLVFLISLVLLMLIVAIGMIDFYFTIFFPALLYGYGIGGLLSGIAYASEVKKEHPEFL